MAPGNTQQGQQALRGFARKLRELQADSGNPSGPQLVKASGGLLSTSSIGDLLGGKKGVFTVPQWDRVSAFVHACKAHSEAEGFPLEEPLGDVRHWRRLHGALIKELDELDDETNRPAFSPSGGHESQDLAGDRGAGRVAESDGAVLPLLAPPPAVPTGFTGREQDLDSLLALLAPSTAAGGPAAEAVVVASVLGMGGMGKTTLATATAHTAVERGLFTGVLFIDLHGYDDNTLDAAQALDTALRGLGVEHGQIPPDTDQRAALYRAQLAARTRHGERILILADNTSSGDQVEHLLPSADGPHRLLVTSRDNLAPRLGARLVDLDVLTPDDAVSLMDTALRITLPKDGRISADPAGAARVAELCGYLPLALRIATAQLGRHLKPAQLARELEDLGERLDVLGGRDGAVRAVLAGSYRRLAPTHAELFRLLAVNPGPDVSTETAVAFTGIGKPRDVRRRLEVLAEASLIRQDPDTGRWRMHDLVRAYAGEQAELNPRHTAAALGRLFVYYTRTARAAAAHLNPSMDGGKKPFLDRKAAMAWLDAERAGLVSAVRVAHTTGHREATMRLASFLGDYLDSRRYLQDALDVATLAHDSAISLGDRHGEGIAWNNLGNVLQELRRFEEALAAHQHALDIYRDLGDRHHEGMAWNNLGLSLKELRRFEEALAAHQHALDIYRDLGDRHHEGRALGNLGNTLKELRRFEEALATHQHALDIHRDLGDRHSKGMAWNNLGVALKELRRFEEALAAHQHALDIYRDLGDRHHEGMAWNNLGLSLKELRRFEEALAAHQHALDIYRDLGDRHHEGMAWNNLGLALKELRRFEEALTAHQHTLDIHRDLGDRHSKGIAWNNLGVALQDLRRFEEALTAHQHALDIYRDLGDRHHEGRAWNNLGVALKELRRFEEALVAHQHAVDIYRDLGDRHDEGRALGNLGVALKELRRFEEALATHQHTLDIHRDLGDRHSEGMAWNNLGTAWRGAEVYGQAVEAGERAVALFGEFGDLYRLGEASDELADTLLAAGRPPAQVRAMREESAAAYRAAGAEDEATKALAKADK
ncbi:tetratricopeptide repeat protein [Kitasatospora sp. NPDC008115]|uniref:tetratricopeptide repeat protein n=1 Tax=Kitasatospora sp. NPDC008115 TaxID=3364022 RepID=UPI0036DFDF39